MELGYLDLGEGMATLTNAAAPAVANVSFSADGPTLAFIGSARFGHWEPFAKLGMFWQDVQFSVSGSVPTSRPQRSAWHIGSDMRTTVWLLLLAVLSAFPPARAAEEQPLTVEALQCRGNATTSCEFILGQLYLSAGDRVNEEEIENAKLRLSFLRNFSAVSIFLERGSERGKAVVVVEVTEANPRTYSAHFHAARFLNSTYQVSAADVTDYNLFGRGKILSFGATQVIPLDGPEVPRRGQDGRARRGRVRRSGRRVRAPAVGFFVRHRRCAVSPPLGFLLAGSGGRHVRGGARCEVGPRPPELRLEFLRRRELSDARLGLRHLHRHRRIVRRVRAQDLVDQHRHHLDGDLQHGGYLRAAPRAAAAHGWLAEWRTPGALVCGRGPREIALEPEGMVDGLQFFRKMQQDGFLLPVIFISGNASLTEAAQAVKLGAFDFLEKPFSAEKIAVLAKRCLEFSSIKERLRLIEAQHPSMEIVGDSPAIHKVVADALKVAATNANVLITGESGTGKELVANSIHARSARRNGPFVKVNCSAIPEGLLESELFGHESGAFTGANGSRKGLFEVAHRGVIFLDEVADLSLTAQSKILRVIQSGELQKRPEDIPLLAQFFAKRLCEKNNIREKPIEDDVLAELRRYQWPGNVRELQNVMERIIIMSGSAVTTLDLPEEIFAGSDALPERGGGSALRTFRDSAEREFIVATLRRHNGNISQSAIELGVGRTYLHRRLLVLKISKKDWLT